MTKYPKSVADLRAQQVLLRRDVHELENIIADQIDLLPDKLMPDFLQEPGSLVGNLAKKGLNMVTGNAFAQENSSNYDQIGYDDQDYSPTEYDIENNGSINGQRGISGLNEVVSTASQFMKSPIGKMVISVVGSIVAKKITKRK